MGYADALSALGSVKIDAARSQTGSIVPGSQIQASLDGFHALSGVDTTSQTPFIDYLGEDMEKIKVGVGFDTHPGRL